MRRGGKMTSEEVAQSLEQLAERLVSGDRSFELQLLIQPIDEALIAIRHIEGLKTLNRISQLLLAASNPSSKPRYEYVAKALAKLPPLDPVADSAALRELAAELRGADSSGG